MYQKEEQIALAKTTNLLLKNDKISKADIEDLRNTIKYHEWRYYILNEPVISDFEYDTIYKKLENLEKEFPELITNDSPTQRVSGDLIENFNQVAHLTPMLSLANSYDEGDLNEFDKQVHKFAGVDETAPLQYSVEPKFDGGTIVLVYENNQFIRAATRGDGEMGEEMTLNARAMKSIPLSANFSKYGIYKAEIRGEALIRKDKFESLNQKREEEGQPVFANPRNAATGGLRMKDPAETAKREIEVFVYQLGFAVDKEGNSLLNSLKNHSDTLKILSEIGFKVPVEGQKVCKNIGEVVSFCAEWQEKRDKYAYELDGMVVKLDSLQLQEECGYTNHHPRWAIAYKFKAKQATTKLLNVEYQVGKIGTITPVAKLEPVSLAGVVVSSVSLHNEDFINSKDIRIGDTVLVERAGDVIPYIVKPIEAIRDGSEKVIVYPKYCPMNTKEQITLVRAEGEAAWRCPNCTCGAQDLQRMIFHVSKDAMDIDGFGKSNVERFFQLGLISTLPDIYNLDYEKIATLEGFGKKSVENLKAGIEKAKKSPINRVLYSLSIHHLGQKVSKLLAEQIGHVLDLRNWEIEDYTKIRDIGPVVAQNTYQFFKDYKNIAMLQQLEANGVNLTQTPEDKPTVIAEDAPLFGKTILFTGTLNLMGRKEAEAMAAAAGAKNISAVSSNLNILVVGENAGSKLEKAQKLGKVQIMTEAEFLEIINS